MELLLKIASILALTTLILSLTAFASSLSGNISKLFLDNKDNWICISGALIILAGSTLIVHGLTTDKPT